MINHRAIALASLVSRLVLLIICTVVTPTYSQNQGVHLKPNQKIIADSKLPVIHNLYTLGQIAIKDRTKLVQQGYHPLDLFYLTLHSVPPSERQKLYEVVCFVTNSTTRQRIVDYCSPVVVATTGQPGQPVQQIPLLLRLNLRNLKWNTQGQFAHIIQKHYPYTNLKLPLVISAQWYIQHLTDTTASDSYYRLLYGKKYPKTKSEFLKFWRIDNTVSNRFGLIEGNSGVSKAKIRWIENRPLSRGYSWGTKDVFKISKKNDPLNHLVPPSNFKADGEEWIIGIPKIFLGTTPATTGTLQVYALFNGKGELINKADGDLVEDHTKYKGLAQIRTPGSCIQCHSGGLNPPNINEYKQLILKGVDTYASYKDKEAIEVFHLSDINKLITRNNEDYQDIIRLICPPKGDKSEQSVISTDFRNSINDYVSALSIARCAKELFSSEKELALAISYASALGTNLSPRITALPHDHKMPRSVFEDEYPTLKALLINWRRNVRNASTP